MTHLTATLSAGTNVAYAWNFGDGVLGSGATTSHIYPARGHLHRDGHGDEQRGQCRGDDSGHHHRCADQRLERGQRQPDAGGQRDAPHGDAERGHERGVRLELWRRRGGQRRDDLAHLSGRGHLHGDGHGDEQRGQCGGDDGGHHHRCADQRLERGQRQPDALGNVTHLTATLSAGTNVTYAWNFGDGVLGSGATTSHVYPAVGTYTATVTATNNVGSVVATTVVYVFTNPVAQAGPDQTVRTGDPVTLDGSASFDPGDFVPLTYHWEQPGGLTVALGNADNVTTTFTTPAVTQTQVLTFELTVTNTYQLASLPDVVVITVNPYRVSLPIVIK